MANDNENLELDDMVDTSGVEIHTDESSAEVTAVDADYGAEQIQILEGLEAVRMRPGMYIGSTSERGLHHLVYEVVDNSIDEALAGYCDKIDVTIHRDNSITVTDNGRGIPVDMHESGMPAVEVVLTVLHAGGKFGGDGYKVSGGLHGVGVSVVNALSTSMEVQVKRDGKIHEISFKRGETVEKLHVTGETEITGTRVHFVPDPEIFSVTTYSFDTLKHRLRELAFLNHGITIVLNDERGEELRSEKFHFEGGISSFVEHLNRKKEKINPQPIFSHSKRSWSIELEYKKADPKDKGSWDAFLAYRHLGHYSTIAPTYDTIYNGRRGVELGVSYVFLKNLMGTVKFFRGEKMPDDDNGDNPGPRDQMEDDSVIFVELNFFF